MNKINTAYWPPTSRSSNPATSYEAEAAVTRSGARQSQAERCLEYVTENPGRTVSEIGEGTGIGQWAASRRLSDLMRQGKLRQGEPRRMRNGRMQCTWHLAAEMVQGRLV